MDMHFIAKEVLHALAEDIGSGDISAALIPADCKVRAEIISREPMLCCGQPWVDAVFAALNPSISLQWLVKEGEWLSSPMTICQIHGSARAILTAERTALNFLQTLSATATQTHYYVQAIKGYSTKLLDTRKTLPGLRMAQKYAVVCGGGMNHRIGLYDAFLIKENHIKACQGIAAALTLAKQMQKNVLIEVEVETLEELDEALQAGADRILLDNFSTDRLVEAVARRGAYDCQLEASGGINLSNIAAIAKTGVDYISVGAITKSIAAIDLSLLIREFV